MLVELGRDPYARGPYGNRSEGIERTALRVWVDFTPAMVSIARPQVPHACSSWATKPRAMIRAYTTPGRLAAMVAYWWAAFGRSPRVSKSACRQRRMTGFGNSVLSS
ncbi:hypothetical protein ABZ926_08610 [Streptomyces litmocidini]|uniref:hypothetical protein n=1 Tax=Streptomyces litmocidini TaxID=67318 RepID=UPI0033E16BFD